MGIAIPMLSNIESIPCAVFGFKSKTSRNIMYSKKVTVKVVTVANKMVKSEDPAKQRAEPNATQKIPIITVSKVDASFL